MLTKQKNKVKSSSRKSKNSEQCEFYKEYYGRNDDDDDDVESDNENGYENDTSADRVSLLNQNNKKYTIINGKMSAATTTNRPIPATTTPLYDGYATIRARGLTRSLSIRANEIETANDDSETVQERLQTPIERKRTLSLRSNYSQSSLGSNEKCQNYQQLTIRTTGQCKRGSTSEEIYANRKQLVKPVKTPTINDIEPLYASTASTFRPLSDASSSTSGGGSSLTGCRDSVLSSTCSGVDYQNIKKNSRFSLDSLQSSATPHTPDYATADEENIFLYTAPASPKRRLDSGVRNSFDSTEHCYSPVPRTHFELHEQPVQRVDSCTPSENSHSSNSPAKARRTPSRSMTSSASSHYQRTQSLIENRRASALSNNSFGSSFMKSHGDRTTPPPAPVRRESLYAKPKSTASSLNQLPNGQSPTLSEVGPLSEQNSPRQNYYQLPIAQTQSPSKRSTSNELIERSYTSHSLATIDQDEILVVPVAMPVLPNPVDRRYHTLGHMRVQSMGSSLHHVRDSPMSSMINMLAGNYYTMNGHHSVLQPHKSAGNIYTSADAAISEMNRLAPEYMDPLDFKIGCQTTLRSKPLIPWYELAIRKDFKRQSCPPISGAGFTQTQSTLSIGNTPHEPKAHVVSAFEQSLSNMTTRLHQLTATAERKDGELTDMRQTIELLRKQSIQAGLTTAHMQSMGVQTQSQSQNDLLSDKATNAAGLNALTQQAQHQQQQQQQQQHLSRAAQHQQQQQQLTATNGAIQRHHSSDSMCSLNSISSNCSAQDKNKKKKGWLRSSFTKAFSRNAKISKTSRHVGHHHQHTHSHAHGANAAQNGANPQHPGLMGNNAANSGGLNNNNKAGSGLGNKNGEPVGLSALATQPPPPLPHSPTKNSSPAKMVTLIDNAKPIDAIDQDDHQMVEELKRQLREKELVLTDIRLEALSSASQLESLKETVNKMRVEMLSLKQNNERLQKLVTSRSLAGSEASLGNAISPNGSIGDSRRYSLADNNSRPPMELPKRLDEEIEDENIPPAPAPEPPPPPLSPTTHIDLTPPPALEPIPSPAHLANAAEEIADITDGKKIAIACYLGQPESFAKYCEEMLEADEYYSNGSLSGATTDKDGNERLSFPTPSLNEFVIAYTYISGKTSWQNLDYIVRKTFKDYVSRIDPGTNLGLNTDSITSYHLGEAKRGPEMSFPELLPCGYIVGNVRTLYICLQGVGSLAFDSLIPRTIVHRYISLLTEHRRLILCGPSGTGKSFLARRLAEFLVARSGRGNPSEAIATFNVDHKSSKELRQYLGHIAEQTTIANGASELPSVIILDNLHHASALGDVFSCLLSAGPAAKLPCIIGTMSQATCNTTNLQLHHNFRWVLTANHMEPVKGFLGRFLRRRLFQLELQTQQGQPELATVLAWLPTVWQHINRFLEAHSSSDVTIGPRLFLSCPLDLKDSQVWFTDIWNYHLSPYLIEAVREGVQLYGRRGGAWNDPSAFIRNSYPWPYGPDSVPPLRQINAEDVGLEGVAATNGDTQDPLLNMLMRLQEAANYNENQEQESDCASLDSNVTPDSSAGAE